MSERSYWRNVSRGVTGSQLPTCYPSALERVSPSFSLSPDIYQTYASFMNWYREGDPVVSRILNPCYKEMITQIAWELGGLTCDEVEFYSVDTFREFSQTVKQLVKRECSVVIDVNESSGRNDESVHSLGLLPSENPNYFKLVSNHTPGRLRGFVTLEMIYDELAFPPESPTTLYPFAEANITALPPVD